MARASACRPDMAHPICRSISTIFSTDEVSSRDEVTRFSTPKITPSDDATCYLSSVSSIMFQSCWCDRITEESRCSETNTYTDGSGAKLDRFERVFNLEEA